MSKKTVTVVYEYDEEGRVTKETRTETEDTVVVSPCTLPHFPVATPCTRPHGDTWRWGWPPYTVTLGSSIKPDPHTINTNHLKAVS